MSKVLMRRQPWAVTEGRSACASAVGSDRASADQSDLLERTDAGLQRHSPLERARELPHSLTQTLSSASEDPVTKDKDARRRFGLPAGFVRLGRYGRSVLLEDNVYRLPNGLEFIPQPPAGTLGARNHHYALLTSDQYVRQQRGSVYVRTDGRIFDYAYDHNQAERDMFDTGFTIHDLERTGKYAPKLKSQLAGLRKREKRPPTGRK